MCASSRVAQVVDLGAALLGVVSRDVHLVRGVARQHLVVDVGLSRHPYLSATRRVAQRRLNFYHPVATILATGLDQADGGQLTRCDGRSARHVAGTGFKSEGPSGSYGTLRACARRRRAATPELSSCGERRGVKWLAVVADSLIAPQPKDRVGRTHGRTARDLS